MLSMVNVAVAALSAVVVIMILIVLVWKFCHYKRVTRKDETPKSKAESFRSGIGKVSMTNESKDRDSFSGFNNSDMPSRMSFSVFRRGVPPDSWFDWADHPWLVSEAVEYGWSRFAFAADPSCPAMEICWEVCEGSVDHMQKIRFSPELKKMDIGSRSSSPSCFIKSSLPLPGPPFDDSPFPQEAYFEVTIISVSNDEIDCLHRAKRDPVSGELTKLIPQSSNVSVQSDSLIHIGEINGSRRAEELRIQIKGEGLNQTPIFSVGFSVGGSLPRELPGNYPGSIGFNSNGSLFLDGMKLVCEAEKAEWESKDKVIGCGFDPAQKKVFFTVDSVLVHVINCKSDEFGCPLYPTLAANVDITVLVNFGQTAFKYLPANGQRTPNPCFIAPPEQGSAAGYEDSRDLFSMAIVDPLWLNPPRNDNNNNNGDYRPSPSPSPDRKRGTTMSPERKRDTEPVELFDIAFSGTAGQQAKQ